MHKCGPLPATRESRVYRSAASLRAITDIAAQFARAEQTEAEAFR